MRLRTVFVALALSLLACSGLDRESGVCLPNQMDDVARGYIADKGLLGPGENVRAFYDATVSLDGSEIAMVTDQRVVYHKEGVTTAIALADITSVERSEVAMSDSFLVVGRSGEMLQILIAPMNGGDTFARVLDAARQGAAPTAATP